MSTKIQNKQPPKQPPLQPSDSKTSKRAIKPIRGVFEKPVGSGIWWVNYYVEGVRHREKCGSRSRAVAVYQKRKSDALAGIKLPETFRRKKAVTFNELADDAMVYSKAHKKSHRGDLANLSSLRPEFGKMAAEEITQQQISAYFASRTDLKPASLNRYRSTMSLIFAEGIRNGRITTNPARLVRLHKEDNRRIRYLELKEENLIREIIRKRCPQHEPDFTVALETGMRLSEQHTIEWSQVHLQPNRRQIHLLDTKNGSQRTVTLTEKAVAALEILRAKRTKKTTRVFVTRYGEPMSNPRAWFRLVHADAVKANPKLSDVTWHTFRHTYISRLVMSGVAIAEVQVLAGHRSIQMTARYTHLSPGHQLDAVDKLAIWQAKEAAKLNRESE
jgi:site-specific recombinase XerD